MGFNLGAALGAGTTAFKSTWKEMEEEDRLKKEQAYIDEQRKREKDYNESLKGIPTVGSEYDPQSLPEYMRPPQTAEDQLAAKRGTNVTLAQAPQPPAIDSSLEGAPAGAIPVPVKRKATQADILAMQAGAARQAGYGEKALQFGTMANAEALRGTQALILREAATRGWDGLDDVASLVNDGHKLQRRTTKDGQTEVSYGNNQWVPAGSPMEAATMLTAAMAGDPDKYIQYFNMHDSRELAKKSFEAQQGHYADMADLKRQELALQRELGMAELAARQAASGAEANLANTKLAALNQQYTLLNEFNSLMKDPAANRQRLNALAGQLAVLDHNYLGQVQNADGSYGFVNKLTGYVDAVSKDRLAAMNNNEFFKSGEIYVDEQHPGYRLLHGEHPDDHFATFEEAAAAAQEIASKRAPGQPAAARTSAIPAEDKTMYTRHMGRGGWIYENAYRGRGGITPGAKTKAQWAQEDAAADAARKEKR